MFFVFWGDRAWLWCWFSSLCPLATQLSIRSCLLFAVCCLLFAVCCVWRCSVHDVHHRNVNVNFGQYIMLWDRVWGTFVPYESPVPNKTE